MGQGNIEVPLKSRGEPLSTSPGDTIGSSRTALGCRIDPETVCRIAGQLMEEIDPGRSLDLDITLDSALESDLGLDSLARVELLSRLEKVFQIRFDEEILVSAETIRDLVRAASLEAARIADAEPLVLDLPAHQGTLRAGIADTATTLPEVLRLQTERAPDQVHILLYGSGEDPIPVSHGLLLSEAESVAAGLQQLAIRPGDNIALMLPTGLAYFFCFFGVLLAGAVPVPLYPPARPSQLEDHLRRHLHILSNCQAKLLITVAEAKPLARILKPQLKSLGKVVTLEELQDLDGAFLETTIRPQETAFLQYTSGSTGIPKGVILSHANLLTNIRAMGKVIRAGPEDVFVSWLPLYHDMGLIGAWLGSLLHSCPLIILSPLAFLVRPERWLWAIHRHRGTLSAAPNFGYELCLSKIDESAIEGLDLSSWRMAFNGAEPVSPETITRFSERFADHGFDARAMAPVYGLAESTVGLAFPPPGRGPIIDAVDRQKFFATGKAVTADQEDSAPLRFVACGRPLPEHRVRIVDANDHELPERHAGHLQFSGPSSTTGYFRNARQTASLFHGDWLDTGDLAYIAGQDIYLTSRVKDIIIRGGRNIHPYELEEAIGCLEGIRKGCVAVFGVTDPDLRTEKLVIVAEARSQFRDTRDKLRKRIVGLALDIIGMPPDEVVLAPPRSVLKTSSGKIRRAASRELYERGCLGRPPRAVWLQLTRLTLAAAWQQIRQAATLTVSTLYAGWCWLLFGVLAAATGLTIILLPSSAGRWRTARIAVKALAALTGTRIAVTGKPNLDAQGPLVLVANHQSYLDSLILLAALPVRCGFVGKAELAKNPALRLVLSRLEVAFVERFDSRQAVADTAQLNARAAAGQSLCFFVEGTIRRMAGLQAFHMGAFQIAADNQLPVIPIAIRGTRAKLRSGSWFPRPGPVHVVIGAGLQPAESGWQAALTLRNGARRHILAHCGEPDRDADL